MTVTRSQLCHGRITADRSGCPREGMRRPVITTANALEIPRPVAAKFVRPRSTLLTGTLIVIGAFVVSFFLVLLLGALRGNAFGAAPLAVTTPAAANGPVPLATGSGGSTDAPGTPPAPVTVPPRHRAPLVPSSGSRNRARPSRHPLTRYRSSGVRARPSRHPLNGRRRTTGVGAASRRRRRVLQLRLGGGTYGKRPGYAPRVLRTRSRGFVGGQPNELSGDRGATTDASGSQPVQRHRQCRWASRGLLGRRHQQS